VQVLQPQRVADQLRDIAQSVAGQYAGK